MPKSESYFFLYIQATKQKSSMWDHFSTKRPTTHTLGANKHVEMDSISLRKAPCYVLHVLCTSHILVKPSIRIESTINVSAKVSVSNGMCTGALDLAYNFMLYFMLYFNGFLSFETTPLVKHPIILTRILFSRHKMLQNVLKPMR